MPACCSKALPGFIHPEAHRKVIAVMVPPVFWCPMFWCPRHIKLLFQDKLSGAHDSVSELPSSQLGTGVTCLRGTFATLPTANLRYPVQLSLRGLLIGGLWPCW